METDKQLSEKARLLRNDYQRHWFSRHPGKHAEYTNRYWLKKAIQSEKEDQAKQNSKTG